MCQGFFSEYKDFSMNPNLFLSTLIFLPILLYFGESLLSEFKSELLNISDGFIQKQSHRRSLEAIEAEFPLVVELFAILIGGGMSPSSALSLISQRGEGEFIRLLSPIIAQMKQGINLAQALDILNKKVDSRIIRRFCDSLAISVERGTPLIEVVGRQVEEVRQAQRMQIAERASKAEIQLMIPVVFLILPISILFALWPSYFALGKNFGG
jgi:tight adherence protein C